MRTTEHATDLHVEHWGAGARKAGFTPVPQVWYSKLIG